MIEYSLCIIEFTKALFAIFNRSWGQKLTEKRTKWVWFWWRSLWDITRYIIHGDIFTTHNINRKLVTKVCNINSHSDSCPSICFIPVKFVQNINFIDDYDFRCSTLWWRYHLWQRYGELIYQFNYYNISHWESFMTDAIYDNTPGNWYISLIIKIFHTENHLWYNIDNGMFIIKYCIVGMCVLINICTDCLVLVAKSGCNMKIYTTSEVAAVSRATKQAMKEVHPPLVWQKLQAATLT